MNGKGFTLVEVLTVIAILGIMTAFAIPSYYEMVRNNNVRSDMELLSSALGYAKSYSIKNRVSTTVCPVSSDSATSCDKTNNWTKWAVFSDGQLLKYFESKNGVTGSNVEFLSTGFSSGSALFSAEPVPCKNNNRRELSVTMAGSLHIARKACS